MARVHVVCDASYDDRIRLTGYSGHVYINPENRPVSAHQFGGVIGEFTDVHQGEIFAIIAGLLTLRELQEKYAFPLHQLIVHTDSQTAIDEWQTAMAGQRKHWHYTKLMDRGIHLLQQQQWTPLFEHVHGHVPYDIASPIERLHELADKNARHFRRQALSHMLNPIQDNSPHYTILLPPTSRNKQEADSWQRLAQHLATQGKRGRIFISQQRAQQNHPFLASLSDFAQKNQISRLELAHQYLFNPNQSPAGLDVTLARYHLLMQGEGSTADIENDPALLKAACASRLLFGEPDPGFIGARHLTGRLQPASQIVYDLLTGAPGYDLHPHSTHEWVLALSRDCGIPVLQGLEKALTYHHIPSPSLLTTGDVTPEKEDPIAVALKKIHDEYANQLERHQWARMWVDTLCEQGFPKNTPFREAMHRYIMITDHGSINRLITQTLRHARKITPPPTKRCTASNNDAPRQDLLTLPPQRKR